ncbi:MAG: 50S ribosomal protein L4 [Candidatus Marsarchaeota archaeon]|jgi:large subunit ribosomal protein L4e|nr:50S ribosomal protein L4 [Candidatus Marsarchaeota archaeon]
MEVDVYKLDGSVEGKVTLPSVFEREFREDLIRRAILSDQSFEHQPQGHYILAGMQTTAVYVGKYTGYRRGRHMGMAIRPRQKLGGGAMGDVRRIPSSVKGRRAHPHRPEKNIFEQINKKEYDAAIASAIAGSSNKELVHQKHVSKMSLPIVIDDNLESVAKTKNLLNTFKSLGLLDDVEKSHKPRLRIGMRRVSNKRRFRSSVLIIAKNAENIIKAGRNIPGVDVCSVDDMKIEKLAPGAKPRLIVWTKSALGSVGEKLR